MQRKSSFETDIVLNTPVGQWLIRESKPPPTVTSNGNPLTNLLVSYTETAFLVKRHGSTSLVRSYARPWPYDSICVSGAQHISVEFVILPKEGRDLLGSTIRIFSVREMSHSQKARLIEIRERLPRRSVHAYGKIGSCLAHRTQVGIAMDGSIGACPCIMAIRLAWAERK